MGSISIWQILVILLVILLVFGLGKLPTVARDLGKAIKGFRASMQDDERSDPKEQQSKDKDQD